MPQTKAGAILARNENYRKYGENYYREIGRKGGSVKVPKGFAISGLASIAGTKGGKISKRRPSEE